MSYSKKKKYIGQNCRVRTGKLLPVAGEKNCVVSEVPAQADDVTVAKPILITLTLLKMSADMSVDALMKCDSEKT